MIRPDVPPRMIKEADRAGFRIDRCEVRALVLVAEIASEGQITGIRRASVLYRDDVIRFVRDDVHSVWQAAIFTIAAGPLIDQLP
jgi:hypothetical protein